LASSNKGIGDCLLFKHVVGAGLWFQILLNLSARISPLLACVTSSAFDFGLHAARDGCLPRGPCALGPGLHRSHSFPSKRARIRSSEAGRMASFALSQLILNATELLQRCLKACKRFSLPWILGSSLHEWTSAYARVGQALWGWHYFIDTNILNIFCIKFSRKEICRVLAEFLKNEYCNNNFCIKIIYILCIRSHFSCMTIVN